MRKKLILFVGLTGILLSSKSYFRQWKNTDTIQNKIGCRIFEFNKISVKIDGEIDLDKIKIKNNGNIIFQNGKQRGKINQEYGHRMINLFYDGHLITSIGNFNRNNWFSNDYEFSLSKHGEEILCSYKIVGPDGQNDNFQKLFIRDNDGDLIRVDYKTQSGETYRTVIENLHLERSIQ